MKVSYRASRDAGVVSLQRKIETDTSIEFERILIETSRSVRDLHVPFEMGFAGLGPQQLALAMLLDACDGVLTFGGRDLVDLSRPFMMAHLSAAALSVDDQVVEYSRDMVLAWLRSEVAHV